MSAEAKDVVTPQTKIYQLPDARKEDVIALLENWLDQARAGEVQAIAVCAILDDQSVESDWSIGMDSMRVIGALAQAQHDLMSVPWEPEDGKK